MTNITKEPESTTALGGQNQRFVMANEGDKLISPEALRQIVEMAHMAGQADACVDPGYSNAREYYDRVFES